MSAEDAIKADILAPWGEKWGKGFINKDRMIGFAFQDMTRLASDGKGS